MIIQCEKCLTKFDIDESLLKEEGSKVRCSLCKHIFVSYPPDVITIEEDKTEENPEEQPPPVSSEDMIEDLFEKSQEKFDTFEAISPEDLNDLIKEESAGTEMPEDETYMKGEHLESSDKLNTTEEHAIRKRPGKSRFMYILLVTILVLVAGGGAIFFWAPELVPDYLSLLKPAEKQQVTDTGAVRLSFSDVTGSFVDSEKAGKLFVIQGAVVNNYPKSRSFIQIKASILNSKGQAVREKQAYAGNTFTKDEIKDLPLEKMNAALKNQYGMGRKNFNLGPGARVPFTIVFENLPEDLSEFTVEAISSSPGI